MGWLERAGLDLLSEHHLSETAFFKMSQEKYDYVIFLQPKSPKKCCKKFENRFTSKIIMPKIILNRPFACAREVIHTPEN